MEDYGLNESMLQETAPSEPAPSEPAPSEPQLFEYQSNGKVIKEDLDTILKRASMGYNYAQHMNEFKQKQTEFEQRWQQAQELENQWKPYVEYAQQNPDWANHWKQAYENRFNSFGAQQSEQPFSQSQQPLSEVTALKSQLEELRHAYEEDKRLRMTEQQDIELNNQIQSVMKEYPDIDFSYTDPATGKSLEYQVLEHGSINGISSFRAAFRDFYHDQLIKNQVSKAKEMTAKELQKRQQKGFMSTSDTPQLVTNQPRNLKSMSYEQLIAQGMQDLTK